MAKANFDACLAHIFQSEGGFVDHPRDPGGATNLGITHAVLSEWRKRPVTKAEVRDLKRSEAAAIYRKKYWDPVRGDELPKGLDLIAFDGVVNSGVYRGARWLQSAVGADPDGVIGPKTLAAARVTRTDLAIKRAIQGRRNFLLSLPTWNTFGRGWTHREMGAEKWPRRLFTKNIWLCEIAR